MEVTKKKHFVLAVSQYETTYSNLKNYHQALTKQATSLLFKTKTSCPKETILVTYDVRRVYDKSQQSSCPLKL